MVTCRPTVVFIILFILLKIISASMKNQAKPVPPFIGLSANYDPVKNAIVENVPTNSVRSNETPQVGKTEAYDVVRQVLDDEDARRSTETRSNRSLVQLSSTTHTTASPFSATLQKR